MASPPTAVEDKELSAENGDCTDKPKQDTEKPKQEEVDAESPNQLERKIIRQVEVCTSSIDIACLLIECGIL